MHIYQSHLGGIYTSKEKHDIDFLYCETCGDYDSYLGDANTLEQAWQLLKPHTISMSCPCIDCQYASEENNERCDNCEAGKAYDEDCGEYDPCYVMKVLENDFNVKKKTYVYVVEMDKTQTACLVRMRSHYEEGSLHEIPHVFCVEQSMENILSNNLMAFFGSFEDFVFEKTEKFCECSKGDIEYHIYLRKTDASRVGIGEYFDNDWYAFIPIGEISVDDIDMPVLMKIREAFYAPDST